MSHDAEKTDVLQSILNDKAYWAPRGSFPTYLQEVRKFPLPQNVVGVELRSRAKIYFVVVLTRTFRGRRRQKIETE